MNSRSIFSVFIVALFLGCASGEKALGKMSPEEQAFAVKLQQVKPGMSEEEVISILGDDYWVQPQMRMWYPTGSSASQVRVMFEDKKVRSVRWIKLGSFIYEPVSPK